MTIYERVRTAILAGSPSPVAAIVGDRVYADELPDPAILPTVVILVVAEPRPGNDLEGTDALALALVQVDCWAATRAACEALQSAVVAAMATGLGGDATLENRRDGRDEQSRLEARRTILEFMVTHTET